MHLKNLIVTTCRRERTCW